MSLDLGRPSTFIIWGINELFPEWVYRYVTFLMFYIDMLFVYDILKIWLNANDEECFWISAMFAVLPANDARIMLCVFPYTFGLFFFLAGTCYFSWQLNKEKIPIINRVLSYSLYILGFSLNSTLSFYGIVLIIIYVKKGIREIWHYIDYCALPIIFYLVKKLFFPAQGGYVGYNEITSVGLLNALKLLVKADIKCIKVLVYNCVHYGNVYLDLLFILILAIYYNRTTIFMCFKNDKQAGEHGVEEYHNVQGMVGDLIKNGALILLCGGVALSAGLYPYVVVRQTFDIRTSGPLGRDAVLIALGCSMIYYAVVDCLFQQKAALLKRYVFSFIIVGGVLFFNYHYLAYQWDYYKQLGFQYQVNKHQKEFVNSANIIYLSSDAILDGLDQIYVLNGNAEMALGDQTRFFMNGFQATKWLTQKEEAIEDELNYFVEDSNYHMSDYDCTNKKVDAIVKYAFNMPVNNAYLAKYYELVNNKTFLDYIADFTSMEVILDGTIAYEACLNENGYKNIE